MSDPSTTYAPELGERLRALFAERAAAASSGLDGNRTYMADLEHEISCCRDAYVGAAVTEIAAFRGVLDGPLYG
jgi:hypothetical protein